MSEKEGDVGTSSTIHAQKSPVSGWRGSRPVCFVAPPRRCAPTSRHQRGHSWASMNKTQFGMDWRKSRIRANGRNS